MKNRIVTTVACLLLAACNSESPTELGAFNAALISGRWSFSFSGPGCAPKDIEASWGQFNNGGALPVQIGLTGSWQTVGESGSFGLDGQLDRDTGEVFFELIDGVRTMDGIFLDNETVALGYSDSSDGCRARASGRKIQ